MPNIKAESLEPLHPESPRTLLLKLRLIYGRPASQQDGSQRRQALPSEIQRKLTKPASPASPKRG